MTTQAKAGHTPGPWAVGWTFEADSEKVLYGVNIDDRLTVSDGEANANATLIAAAPDLLASLREFIEPYSTETSTGNPELARARAAIAKAEGR